METSGVKHRVNVLLLNSTLGWGSDDHRFSFHYLCVIFEKGFYNLLISIALMLNDLKIFLC